MQQVHLLLLYTHRVLHKKLLEVNTSTIGYIHRTPTKSPARTSISPITMSSKVYSD